MVVDAAGQPVRLRGFNVNIGLAGYRDFRRFHTQDELFRINRQILENFINDDDYSRMRAMGANLLRTFAPKWWMIEYEPYKYDEKYLDLIEQMVNRAYGYGLRTLLVMNDAGESPASYLRDTREGTGMMLWTDRGRRAQVIAVWELMARRFANNPGVVGYDLMNEPKAPSREALHGFYQDVIHAIRKHDRNHILFLDTTHFPIDLAVAWGGTYDDPNLVLETHYYRDVSEKSFAEVMRGKRQYDTRQQIEDGLKQLQSHKERDGRPLFIGEFGAYWETGERGLRWTRDTIDVLNANGVHWSYYQYKSPQCTRASNSPNCTFPRTLGLYVPSRRLFLHLSAEEKSRLRETGLPVPTQAQLQELRTRQFVTNTSLQEILSKGLAAP